MATSSSRPGISCGGRSSHGLSGSAWTTASDPSTGASSDTLTRQDAAFADAIANVEHLRHGREKTSQRRSASSQAAERVLLQLNVEVSPMMLRAAAGSKKFNILATLLKATEGRYDAVKFDICSEAVNMKGETLPALAECGMPFATLRDLYGNTLAHRAAVVGDLATMRLLVDHGVPVTEVNQNGQTVLHELLRQSAEHVDPALVSFVLENGVDPNVVDRWGGTALGNSIARGHTDAALVILDAAEHAERGGAGPSIPLELSGVPRAKGMSPLHVAAQHGNVRVIEKLARCGVGLDTPCDAGNTPLHYAVEHARCAGVSALLALGATPDVANKHGATPMHIAMRFGFGNILNVLAPEVKARRAAKRGPAVAWA